MRLNNHVSQRDIIAPSSLSMKLIHYKVLPHNIATNMLTKTNRDIVLKRHEINHFNLPDTLLGLSVQDKLLQYLYCYGQHR